MARRGSFRKPKESRRSHRSRVSDPSIYPYSPHPQATATTSSAPRRASAASYTTQTYPHRPNPSRDPQKQAYTGRPLPPRTGRPIESHEPFLRDDEDLRLKTLQHPDGTATGFPVVNRDMPRTNNTCAPLPNGGITFDVDNGMSAFAARERAKGAFVSGNNAGTMSLPLATSTDLPCVTATGAARFLVQLSRRSTRQTAGSDSLN
ncbi:hypothetical protein Neosp_004322 [[Neocosmospora] mangrovei]